MSSSSSLSDAEVSLILGMLDLRPPLSNQAILAHFTLPGRDINHRVIAEIENGQIRPGIAPATSMQVAEFMAAAKAVARPDPEFFISGGHGARRPNAKFRLRLDWWPVGQGLFASGAIFDGTSAPLNWVYDCGTTSSDTLLLAALDRFSAQQAGIGATRIRLCVLSHFDRDHVSGIVRLIERFAIDTLLLPYVPLWRRLIIALEQRVGPEDPFLGFYLDPVAYLAGGDGRIGQIVFVPPSGPDGPTLAGPEDVDGDPEGGELSLKVERGEPPEDAANDPAASPRAGVAVHFMRCGGRVEAPLWWEFVPYNDAGLAPKATPAFLAAAEALTASLLNDPAGRATALKDLKLLYDEHFGDTSELRNLISLFLYSGPLGRVQLQPFPWPFGAAWQRFERRCSQIHTGDGTLDEGRRYDEFAKFFGAGGRLSQASFFQVMHHGSRNNWHEGIAQKVAPDFSIFSSDPAHKRFRHPHPEVLRDFWMFGPAQVGRADGFHIHCWLTRQR